MAYSGPTCDAIWKDGRQAFGRPILELIPPMDTSIRLEDILAIVERTGEATPFLARAPDGHLVRLAPARVWDSGGRTLINWVIGRYTLSRADAETRLRFLLNAGLALSASLDYEKTLATVADLAVPELADWCTVFLPDEGGRLRRIALSHIQSHRCKLLLRIHQEIFEDLSSPTKTIREVFATNKSILVSQYDAGAMRGAAISPEHLRLLQEAHPESYMFVPLSARGGCVGVMSLISLDSGRHYGPADLELAERLGLQAAIAVDHTLLYGEAQRLSAAARLSPEPLFLFKADGIITDVNPAVATTFGWQAEELVGQHVSFLVPPESREQQTDFLRRVRSGEDVRSVEVQRVTRSGQVLDMLASYTLVRSEDGETSSVVAILHDITELKRFQRHLAASLEQMRLIQVLREKADQVDQTLALLNVVVSSLVADFSYAGAAIFFWNDQESTLVRRAWSGALTGTSAENEILRLEAVPEPESAPRPRSGSPDSPAEMVICLFRRGSFFGELRVYETRKEGFSDEQVSALQVIGSKLVILIERLGLIEELQAKHEEMTAFLFAASHDLRSPLVNVVGFSDELQKSVNDLQRLVTESLPPTHPHRARLMALTDEDIGTSLKFINTAARKMEVLVDGLLQLSRVGRLPLLLESVRAEEVVAEALALFQSAVKNAGARVEVGPLPDVTADRTQLSQVFQNLLDNAVKYLEPSRPGLIRIFGERQEHWCRFCVEDNGIGMDPTHVAQIFRPFHRLETGRNVEGHGLGLSIVERVIRRHLGRVWAESDEGAGTRIWFELPVAPISPGGVVRG